MQAPNPGTSQQTNCKWKVLERTSSVVQKGNLVLSRVKSANERNHGADSSLHNIATLCTRSLKVYKYLQIPFEKYDYPEQQQYQEVNILSNFYRKVKPLSFLFKTLFLVL